jgi:hypothetical protein
MPRNRNRARRAEAATNVVVMAVLKDGPLEIMQLVGRRSAEVVV